MAKKKGAKPKPIDEHRKNQKKLLYSDDELKLIEEAYEIAEKPYPFARWLANITLDEAKKIVTQSKK